jgi:hypothetical protein
VWLEAWQLSASQVVILCEQQLEPPLIVRVENITTAVQGGLKKYGIRISATRDISRNLKELEPSKNHYFIARSGIFISATYIALFTLPNSSAQLLS